MAPTILQGTADQGTGTSAAPTLPGGLAADDVALFALCKDDNDNPGNPTGYTTIWQSDAGGTGTMESMGYADTLAGSESGAVTASWSGSEDFVAELLVIDDTNGVDFDTGDYDSANRTSASVSGTVTDNDSLAVVVCASEDAGSTFTAPDGSWSSLTRLTEGSGVTGAAQQVFYKTLNSGATGTLTFTQSETQEFQVTLIVFGPSGGAAPAPTPRMTMY